MAGGVNVPRLDQLAQILGLARAEVEQERWVMLAQTLLKRRGFYPGPIDGEFGSATAVAVMRAQRERGLPCSGVVDDDTWDALIT